MTCLVMGTLDKSVTDTSQLPPFFTVTKKCPIPYPYLSFFGDVRRAKVVVQNQGDVREPKQQATVIDSPLKNIFNLLGFDDPYIGY